MGDIEEEKGEKTDEEEEEEEVKVREKKQLKYSIEHTSPIISSPAGAMLFSPMIIFMLAKYFNVLYRTPCAIE